MRKLCVAVVLLAGCSYTPENSGDDVPGDDAPPGDGNSGDGPVAVTCGYTEQQDATNDTSATAEPSGLAFAGTTVLCGQIDSTHFTPQNVDVDAYRFTVATNADVLMHLTAPGAEALDRVVIQVATTAGSQIAFGTFTGDHGTLPARLPAGDYVAAVTAFHSVAILSPLAYQLRIVADQPATRCSKVGGAAIFNEAGDTATSTGNDMIRFAENGTPQRSLTGSNLDAPENVTLTDPKYQLTGSSANVDLNSDSYKDRDTYQITTGGTTNQLSLRLNWTSTTVDFDFLVFPAGSASSLAGGLATSNTEDEFDTFAVEPNTAYWVWIGAYETSTGLPATYDATICNETFTP